MVLLGSLGFNTQPPEGGWGWLSGLAAPARSFNTQPPEGGWQKATAVGTSAMSFNTQPPEGGWAIFRGFFVI